MPNQMIALQARNPQLPDPSRQTAQFANMMNMVRQSEAAQRQASLAQQSMDMNKAQEAIDQYIKAAGKNENTFSSPMYLMKAAMAYEDMKNYDKALEIYTKIRKDFFQSSEGRDAEKYIARLEAIKENGAK